MSIKIASIDLSKVNQLVIGVVGPAFFRCLSCGAEDIKEPTYFCGSGCRVCGGYITYFEHPVPWEKLESLIATE